MYLSYSMRENLKGWKKFSFYLFMSLQFTVLFIFSSFNEIKFEKKYESIGRPNLSCLVGILHIFAWTTFLLIRNGVGYGSSTRHFWGGFVHLYTKNQTPLLSKWDVPMAIKIILLFFHCKQILILENVRKSSRKRNKILKQKRQLSK